MIKYIFNQMFYLQEYGILLGGCLTVKNWWLRMSGIITFQTKCFNNIISVIAFP